MQFEQRRRRTLVKNGESDNDANPYPYWINFYTVAPTYKVSLQEIEEMAGERLKILALIDQMMKAQGVQDPKTKTNNRQAFYDVLKSQIASVRCPGSSEKNFYVAGRTGTDSRRIFDARKRDHISHFLLRIFYCQSEELRRWFVSRETELFRLRFIDSSAANVTTLQDCLVHHGFLYEIVSIVEQPELHAKINWTDYNRANSGGGIAFRLPFEETLDLVRTRRVYLEAGYAYVAANEMISVICNRFRCDLSRELTRMHTNLYAVGEQRLLCRLETLHLDHISNVASKSGNNQNNGDKPQRERIQPEEVDRLARDFFPPCMRSIHETLKREGHLKHYGRLYYGLFLKSIGMGLDDALEFFRQELAVKNPEKFQREYAYTIRYIYGKEGRRVQLSSYSCQKIINENAPGPNDTHGCPFRHYDGKNLKAMLVRYGVNREQDLEAILARATADKNPAAACAQFFAVKHMAGSGRRLPDDFTIHHPSQFYQEARRLAEIPKSDAPPEMITNNQKNGDVQKVDDEDFFMDDIDNEDLMTMTSEVQTNQ